MAFSGHICSQAPQPTQSSGVTSGMRGPPDGLSFMCTAAVGQCSAQAPQSYEFTTAALSGKEMRYAYLYRVFFFFCQRLYGSGGAYLRTYGTVVIAKMSVAVFHDWLHEAAQSVFRHRRLKYL